MELRQLQTFAAAAERLSFTGAAKILGCTQAAVSQQVAALEKELGTRLFERRGRGVQLAEAGRRLYGYARQILDLADEASRQVGHAERRVRGLLRIATSSVPSEWLLPDLLAQFRERWPDVRESLTVSDSRVAAEAVAAGEVDLGFVGELPRISDLEPTPVAEDELSLFVAVDHPMASKGTMTVTQFRKEPQIVRESGSGSRRCVEQAMEELGLSPSDLSIAMEVNSNEAIRAAVKRGVGVAFLSDLANRHHRDMVRIKVRGFLPRRQLYLIHNPGRIVSEPAREFMAFVENWRSKR